MNIDRFVLGFAGIMILGMTLGSIFHHPSWVYGVLFIAGMMFQASLTKFCPLVLILKKFGFKTGKAFD